MTTETELKPWHWYWDTCAGRGHALMQALPGEEGWLTLLYNDGHGQDAEWSIIAWEIDDVVCPSIGDLIGPIADPGLPPPAPRDRGDAERLAREWAAVEAAEDPLRLAVEAMRAEGTAMQEKAVAVAERDEARKQTRTLAAALENVFACFPPPWDAGQFDPDSGAWSVEDAGCNTIEVREGANYKNDPGPEAYTKALCAAVNSGAELLTAMAGGHAPSESAYAVILDEVTQERDRAARSLALAGEDALVGRTLRRVVTNNCQGSQPQGGLTVSLEGTQATGLFHVEVNCGESSASASADGFAVAVLAAAALGESGYAELRGRDEQLEPDENPALPVGWDNDLDDVERALESMGGGTGFDIAMAIKVRLSEVFGGLGPAPAVTRLEQAAKLLVAQRDEWKRRAEEAESAKCIPVAHVRRCALFGAQVADYLRIGPHEQDRVWDTWDADDCHHLLERAREHGLLGDGHGVKVVNALEQSAPPEGRGTRGRGRAVANPDDDGQQS